MACIGSPAALLVQALERAREAVIGWEDQTRMRAQAAVTPSRAVGAILLREAALEAGTRLLDVGCGSGRFLLDAARSEPAAILVGAEIDEDAVAVARARARRSPAHIEIDHADVSAMPYADDYFDVVTCAFVLSQLEPANVTRVLRECARVTRPGGWILIADWAPASNIIEQLQHAAAVGVWAALGRAPRHAFDAQRELERIGLESPTRVTRYSSLAGGVMVAKARKPAAG